MKVMTGNWKLLLAIVVACALCVAAKGSKSNKPKKPASPPGPKPETGSGTTTRYWDCCKPSCAWKENIGSLLAGKTAVKTCSIDGKTTVDPSTQSGCNGGSAYMCEGQQPMVVNDNLAYGFVAANVNGHAMPDFCCACYALKFNDPKLSGKTMIVQVTNTGSDLNNNHFDIQIPGGGVGIFNGCSTQYKTPTEGWGARYGGVSNASECNNLPASLQAGCRFRFEWFKNADNPSMTFTRVRCPAKIVAATGCQRSDDPK